MCLPDQPDIPAPKIRPVTAPTKVAELEIGDTTKRKKKQKAGIKGLLIPKSTSTGNSKGSGLSTGGS